MSMQNSAITIPLAALGSHWMMSKLNLPSVFYGIVHGLVIALIASWNTNAWEFLQVLFYMNETTMTIIWSSFFLIFFGVCVWATYYCYNVYNMNQYHRMEIFNNVDLHNLRNYMSLNEEFYDKPNNVIRGDTKLKIMLQNIGSNRQTKSNVMEHMMSELSELTNLSRAANNEHIQFNDTRFGVHGYITWSLNSVEVNEGENTIHIQLPYLIMCIKPGPLDINSYFEKISKHVLTLSEDNIKLSSTKLIRSSEYNSICSYYFYDGPRLSPQELYDKFMRSYFHPQKEMLCDMIMAIDTQPEKFHQLGQIPRIGLLCHGPPGVGKSSLAYRIARMTNRNILSLDILSCKKKANLYHEFMNPEGKNKTLKPHEVVYVFDEFDSVIETLCKREKEPQVVITMAGDKPKDDVKMKISDSDEDIRMKDLLELFQGPVSPDRTIIIATTNKFEKIKEMCPDLFRPGRLTPFKIDYLDDNRINEMTEYYFNHSWDAKLPRTIPTAFLTEQATSIVFNKTYVTDKEKYTEWKNRVLNYEESDVITHNLIDEDFL